MHLKKADAAHRIVWVEPGTVTLCLLGRRRQNWGFYVHGWHVPPSEYLKETVIGGSFPRELGGRSEAYY